MQHSFSKHVHQVRHPLIAHMLRVIRDKRTPSPVFRDLVAQIGLLLAYEATRDLTIVDETVQTPMEASVEKRLAGPITVVPILRAGIGLADGVLRLIPEAHIGHLGMFRNETSLQPVSYYENIPAQTTEGTVLLTDPMLATGGSAIAATHRLRELGCTDLRFLCLIAAPEGVQRYGETCPDIPIYTACIDRQLNDQGYILPGLGDAGDRMFGTFAT